MDVTGGFPIDIVLFGMVAAFLVLRLRSILGRRTGFERPPQAPSRGADLRAGPGAGKGPVIEGHAEPAAPPPPPRPLPELGSPAGQGLARILQADPGFAPQRFLTGAEQAFRGIVGAYAAGDRGKLRPLLTEETFRAFDAAISARTAAGETLRAEIRAIPQATIEEATLRGNVADITVRFVSDQVNVTLNQDGNPVIGTDAVTEIIDIWTFERDLAAHDHTWRLAAARSG